jgi:hypothetical protein
MACTYQHFYMKLLFLNFLLFISFHSFSQLSFEERKADSTRNKFDSILVIGVGSSVTRLFLENVSEYISQGCTQKKITARYIYTGSNLENSRSCYDTIDKTGFKAILFLLPNSVANFESQTFSSRNTTNTTAGTLVTTTTTTSLTYSQDFSFQLCMPLDNMKKIWIASVYVLMDPKKKRIAKKLAKKVLNSFKDHNYIQ